MYLHALVVTILARCIVQALNMQWSALLRLEPLRQLAAGGEGGLIIAQFLAMCAVYCAVFAGLSLMLALVSNMRDDPGLLQRAARSPAWWATTARPELIWGGLRPYAWAAMILPILGLLIANYWVTREQHLPDPYLGELIALVLLTAIAAAQTLMPFRWGRKLVPALARIPQRIGSASTQRASDPPRERPESAAPRTAQDIRL